VAAGTSSSSSSSSQSSSPSVSLSVEAPATAEGCQLGPSRCCADRLTQRRLADRSKASGRRGDARRRLGEGACGLYGKVG
jgi:hypothetical protein